MEAVSRVFDMVSDAVFFLTARLQIIDCNAAAFALCGYHCCDIGHISLSDVFVDDVDRKLARAIERLFGTTAREVKSSTQLRHISGDLVDVRIQCQVIDLLEEKLVVAVVRSSSDEHEWDECASQDGHRDYVTALPTRAALESHLRVVERRAQRRRSRFSVLFIDLDHFKCVNDAAGHRAGDLVLEVIGRRLQACMRPCDFVARYGGDEFVAVIENVRDDTKVRRIVARIHSELQAPIEMAGRNVQISASIGVATGKASIALLMEADRAMYLAKKERSRRATQQESV
jgi:diguanylate cyclase (GGDEF)-like protein